MEITRQSITMNRNRNRNSFIFHAFPLWLYSLNSESLQIFRRAKNFNIVFFLSPKRLRDSEKQCFRKLSVRSVNRAREKRSATNLCDHCSTIYFISIEKFIRFRFSEKFYGYYAVATAFSNSLKYPESVFIVAWIDLCVEPNCQINLFLQMKQNFFFSSLANWCSYPLCSAKHIARSIDLRLCQKNPLQYEYSNNERKNNINKQRKII